MRFVPEPAVRRRVGQFTAVPTLRFMGPQVGGDGVTQDRAGSALLAVGLQLLVYLGGQPDLPVAGMLPRGGGGVDRGTAHPGTLESCSAVLAPAPPPAAQFTRACGSPAEVGSVLAPAVAPEVLAARP